jgi:hypothetical protein
VASPFRSWANQYFNALEYSGSYAKGTGVRGISDVDVFISLKSDTPGTLKEIYNNLYRFAEQQTWSPRCSWPPSFPSAGPAPAAGASGPFHSSS